MDLGETGQIGSGKSAAEAPERTFLMPDDAKTQAFEGNSQRASTEGPSRTHECPSREETRDFCRGRRLEGLPIVPP